MEIIRLNIGGVETQTIKTTLEKSGYFNGLLNNPQMNKSGEGDILFIDEDYELFKHLLNKMRNDCYEFPQDLKSNLENLADYYLIPVVKTEVVQNNINIVDIPFTKSYGIMNITFRKIKGAKILSFDSSLTLIHSLKLEIYFDDKLSINIKSHIYLNDFFEVETITPKTDKTYEQVRIRLKNKYLEILNSVDEGDLNIKITGGCNGAHLLVQKE